MWFLAQNWGIYEVEWASALSWYMNHELPRQIMVFWYGPGAPDPHPHRAQHKPYVFGYSVRIMTFQGQVYERGLLERSYVRVAFVNIIIFKQNRTRDSIMMFSWNRFLKWSWLFFLLEPRPVKTRYEIFRKA